MQEGLGTRTWSGRADDANNNGGGAGGGGEALTKGGGRVERTASAPAAKPTTPKGKGKGKGKARVDSPVATTQELYRRAGWVERPELVDPNARRGSGKTRQARAGSLTSEDGGDDSDGTDGFTIRQRWAEFSDLNTSLDASTPLASSLVFDSVEGMRPGSSPLVVVDLGRDQGVLGKEVLSRSWRRMIDQPFIPPPLFPLYPLQTTSQWKHRRRTTRRCWRHRSRRTWPADRFKSTSR